MPQLDILVKLQEWYAAQCDGEWEHQHGVKIESCDNPGWWIKIDLVGTQLFGRPFEAVIENTDASGSPIGVRWLNCRVENGVWHGAGDESKLGMILEKFLCWVST